MRYNKYGKNLQSLLQDLWGKTFKTNCEFTKGFSVGREVPLQIDDNWGDGILQAEKRTKLECGGLILCKLVKQKPNIAEPPSMYG